MGPLPQVVLRNHKVHLTSSETNFSYSAPCAQEKISKAYFFHSRLTERVTWCYSMAQICLIHQTPSHVEGFTVSCCGQQNRLNSHSPDPQCLNSVSDSVSSTTQMEEAALSCVTKRAHGPHVWPNFAIQQQNDDTFCVWKQGKLATWKKIPMNNAFSTASCRDIYSPSLWMQDKQHWASSISTEQAFCTHRAACPCSRDNRKVMA